MMQMVFLVTCVLSFAKMASADTVQIPLVRVDASGKSQSIYIDSADYLRILTSGLLAVQDSLTPALLNLKASQSTVKLQSVGVGLSLSARLSLGPVGDVSFSPHVSLQFSEENNP
jgi:hypothetical protein